MKEFYVVLVTIALTNCIGLSQMTGPAPWLRRADNPGTAALFALSTAALLIATTTLSVCALVIAGPVFGRPLSAWMIIALNSATAMLLMLPLAAFLRSRFVLQYQRLRVLLPVIVIEVVMLTSLLISTRTDIVVWKILFWALCAAVGSIFVITIFAGLRLRLSVCDVPKIWQGLPIELVTVAILALALLSPAGA